MREIIYCFMLFGSVTLPGCNNCRPDETVFHVKSETSYQAVDTTLSNHNPDSLFEEVAQGEPHAINTDSVFSIYSAIIEKIKVQKAFFTDGYSKAGDESSKDTVILKAGEYLLKILTEEVFPVWYGTVWDFNGYTDRPQDGYIACGYFVSTPLKQIGFKLNRFRLAQQYSHKIIEILCGENGIKTFEKKDFNAMIDWMLKRKDDLYVVGLDCHVGFLAKYDSTVFFIHSNYLGNGCVESEPATESEALSSSGVFVIGSLFEEKGFVKKWLTGEEIEI